MKKRIELGILYSLSGDYALLSRSSHAGALAGVEAVNADAGRSVEFVPVERDAKGRTEAYGPLCAEILRTSGARHVVGCTTSWSRKDVIPVLERHCGMLWYAAPYEGFEASERVVYLHACPNQHIVPLLGHVVPRWGRNAVLLGSNYVWGWEVNRVARDLIGDAGGRVLAERYLALGDIDVSRPIEEIKATKPSFVLNNLIGASSYAFLKAFAALGREDEAFRAENCPVLSCDLMEPELAALDGAGEGHLVVGPFFADGGGPASSMEAAAKAAVLILADILEAAASEEPEAVAPLLSARAFATPLGRIRIDAQSQHASLPALIGRIEGNRFREIWRSEDVLAPDPYLARYDPRTAWDRPALRVVS